MHARRCLMATAAASAMMSGLLFAGPATAEGGGGGPFCAILTETEIAEAAGADVAVAFGDDISCEWESLSNRDYFTLDAEHHVESIDDSGMRDAGPGTDLEIDGDGAFFLADVGQLLVDLPGGGSLWLTHGGFPVEGVDLQTELTRLAELALPRLSQLALPTPLVVATPETGAFCSILTEAEVTSAMATPMSVVRGTDTTCAWINGDAQRRELDAQYLPYSIDASGIRESDPGTDIEVAGHGGYFMDYKLRIDLDDGGSLELKHTGDTPEGVDLEGLLVGLAELVLPRLAGLPLPTPESLATAQPQGTTAPLPSFVPDTELEALFPTEVAGETVSVRSFRGDVLAAQFDPSNPDQQAALDAIDAALSGQGKSLDDVSYASASGGFGSIIAVRVRGGDPGRSSPRCWLWPAGSPMSIRRRRPSAARRSRG